MEALPSELVICEVYWQFNSSGLACTGVRTNAPFLVCIKSKHSTDLSFLNSLQCLI